MDNGLKLLENELVPVYETSTGEKVVYGLELHVALDVKSPYREWSARRFKDCDAIENEDYASVEISTLVGGTPKKDHIIKLDIAKEMAMLERNEKGKQVRKYFIAVEKKYKQSEPVCIEDVLIQSLQEMKALRKKAEEQDKHIAIVEENQRAITTAMTGKREEGFNHGVNRCLSAIAESGKYQFIGSRSERHRAVRLESYQRLNAERPCRLNQRVDSERGRAIANGMSSAEAKKKISKLSVIEKDKNLKPVYESVIKEMMIAYCVDVA